MSETAPDIYFVKFPEHFKFLGQPFEMSLLHEGARFMCEKAGCAMKTFEYHGIIDAGPKPGQAEGHRAHLWSALQGTRH